MTGYELMDAIGGVDEELLAQSEEPGPGVRATVLRRVLLVAAILAVGAVLLGAMHLMGVPITAFRLTGGTGSVEMDGKLAITGPQKSVRIEIDFPVAEDVTENIRCCYLPKLSEDWGRASGGAHFVGTSDEVLNMGLTWNLPGMAVGEYFYYFQESAYAYRESYETFSRDLVAAVSALPDGISLSAENVMLGAYHVLRVTVDPVKHLSTEQQFVGNTISGLMPDGEVMVFWSDGYHVFHLRYPAWVPDETILAFMESLQPFDTNLKELIGEYVGVYYG